MVNAKVAEQSEETEAYPSSSLSHQSNYSPQKAPEKRRQKHQSTKAVVMSVKGNVSSKKSAKLCQILSESSGINIGTPSQSGVYKATMNEAKKLETRYKYLLYDIRTS